MIPPSGRQIELRFGRQRAVVTEVGGGLRRYDIGDWAVVDGYEQDQMADGGRGQLLLPWPNRIGDGRYHFGGADHQLPLDEPEAHNSIHGLVRWAGWEVSQSSTSSAQASCVLHPRPGYPFRLGLRVDYGLGEEGLIMTANATNLGTSPAPFGAGWHPYLSVGTPFIDDATLCVPADQWVPTDSRGLPRGDAKTVEGTEIDFRQPRRIDGAILDTCYTCLRRNDEGRVVVTVRGAGGTRRVDVWGDRAVNYAMVFTGDTLRADRRRRGVAVEPMTCPPDAFRSGIDLAVIEPAQTFTASWGITPVEGTSP